MITALGEITCFFITVTFLMFQIDLQRKNCSRYAGTQRLQSTSEFLKCYETQARKGLQGFYEVNILPKKK